MTEGQPNSQQLTRGQKDILTAGLTVHLMETGVIHPMDAIMILDDLESQSETPASPLMETPTDKSA